MHNLTKLEEYGLNKRILFDRVTSIKQLLLNTITYISSAIGKAYTHLSVHGEVLKKF